MDIEDPRDNVRPKEDIESVEKFLYEKDQKLIKENEQEREQVEAQGVDDLVLRIERELNQMNEEIKVQNDEKEMSNFNLTADAPGKE